MSALSRMTEPQYSQVQRAYCNVKVIGGIGLKRPPPKAQAPSGITRRGGRSPDRAPRGKEAPAAQDACPRHPEEIESLLRGCSGGDARGAAEGAQPHNRPPLPHAGKAKSHAAQAFQASPDGETLVPKGQHKNVFRQFRMAGTRLSEAQMFCEYGLKRPHPKHKCPLAFTRRGGRSPERAQRGKEAPAAQDACPRRPRGN